MMILLMKNQRAPKTRSRTIKRKINKYLDYTVLCTVLKRLFYTRTIKVKYYTNSHV